ncbi:uncharacterized protein LOC142330055 [Lycorma delicatula]|uniref:uncharacterized protein LOC142330055 n=1 Tax=Lycorma delicatula TaxID=130591 RepID=UPI003F513E7F
MRKTRLIILPGARCLTQMCCLLLYLSCPNVGALCREQLDISRDDLYSQSFHEFKGKKELLSDEEGMCYVDKSRINCEENYLGSHNDSAMCFEIIASPSMNKDLLYGNKERRSITIISTKGFSHLHIMKQLDDRRLLSKYHRIRAHNEITTKKGIRYFENGTVNQKERNSQTVKPMFNRKITSRLDKRSFSKESVRQSIQRNQRETLNVDSMKLNDDKDVKLLFIQMSQLKTKADNRKYYSYSSSTSVSGGTVTRHGNNLTNKRDQETWRVPSELSKHQRNNARVENRRLSRRDDVHERDIHRIVEQHDNRRLNRKRRGIERRSLERLDSNNHSQEIRINHDSLESGERRNTEGNTHRRISREEKRTRQNSNYRYLERQNDERFSDGRLHQEFRMTQVSSALNKRLQDSTAHVVDQLAPESFNGRKLSRESILNRNSLVSDNNRQIDNKRLSRQVRDRRGDSVTGSLERGKIQIFDDARHSQEIRIRRVSSESEVQRIREQRRIPSDFDAHQIIEQNENRHIHQQERNALSDYNMRSLDRRSVERTDNRRLIRDSSVKRNYSESKIQYVTEKMYNRRLHQRGRNAKSDSTVRSLDRRDFEPSDRRRLSRESNIKCHPSESEIRYVANKNENKRLTKKERNAQQDSSVRSFNQQTVEWVRERRLSGEVTMNHVSLVIENSRNFEQIKNKPFNQQVRETRRNFVIDPLGRERKERFNGRRLSQEFRIRSISPESETRRTTGQIDSKRLNQPEGNIRLDSTVHTLDQRGFERTGNRRLIQKSSIRRVPSEYDNRQINEQTERRRINEQKKDTRRDAASRSLDQRTIERRDRAKLFPEYSVRRSSPTYETHISKNNNSHRLSNQEGGARRDSFIPILVRRSCERLDNEKKIREFNIRHVLSEGAFQPNIISSQLISRSEHIRETRGNLNTRSPDQRTLECFGNKKYSVKTNSRLSMNCDTFRNSKHLSTRNNDQRRKEHIFNLDSMQTKRTPIAIKINKYNSRNDAERVNKCLFVERSERRQNNEGQESLSRESNRFHDLVRKTERVENKHLNKEDRNTRKVQIFYHQREFEHLENRKYSEKTRSRISFKRDSRYSFGGVDDKLKKVKSNSSQLSATIRSNRVNREAILSLKRSASRNNNEQITWELSKRLVLVIRDMHHINKNIDDSSKHLSQLESDTHQHSRKRAFEQPGDFWFDDNRRLSLEVKVRFPVEQNNRIEKLEKWHSSRMETGIRQNLAKRSDITHRYVNSKASRQLNQRRISVVTLRNFIYIRFEKLYFHQSMKDTLQVSRLHLQNHRRMGLLTRIPLLNSKIRRNSAELDKQERNTERKNIELRNELRLTESRIHTQFREKPNKKRLTREFMRHVSTSCDNHQNFERLNGKKSLHQRDTQVSAVKHLFSQPKGKRFSNNRFFGELDLSQESAGIHHGVTTLAKLHINGQIKDIPNNRLTLSKLHTLQMPDNFEMVHIVKTGDNLWFIQDRRDIILLSYITNSKSDMNKINGNMTSLENFTEMSNEASLIFPHLFYFEISLSNLKEELNIHPGAIDTEENFSFKENYVSTFTQNLFSSVWSMKEETKAALVGSVACILLSSNVK